MDAKSVGLGNYGPTAIGFYTRQLSTLKEISKIQAKVMGSSGDPVGELFELDKMMKCNCYFENLLFS